MRQAIVMVTGEAPMSIEAFKQKYPKVDPRTGEPLTFAEWDARYREGKWDDTGRAIYDRESGETVKVLG